MRKIIFWIDYNIILPITNKAGSGDTFMKFLKNTYPEQFHNEIEYEQEGNIKCPTCGGTQWYEGPTGGLSINIECTTCNDKFNYTFGFNTLELIGKGKIID